MSEFKEVVQALARALVDDRDAVIVREIEGGRVTVLQLSVAPNEMGRVIGRRGQMANAMRVLLSAAAGKAGKAVRLEIVDGEEK